MSRRGGLSHSTTGPYLAFSHVPHGLGIVVAHIQRLHRWLVHWLQGRKKETQLVSCKCKHKHVHPHPAHLAACAHPGHETWDSLLCWPCRPNLPGWGSRSRGLHTRHSWLVMYSSTTSTRALRHVRCTSSLTGLEVFRQESCPVLALPRSATTCLRFAQDGACHMRSAVVCSRPLDLHLASCSHPLGAI